MITQERLKELLHYCPNSGVFTWRVNVKNSCNIGDVAGWKDRGYIRIMIKGKTYRAHRLAWLYTHGTMPTDQIDHINHIRDDNSIDNLREVNNQDNQRNSPLCSNNTSGVVGVHWRESSKRWNAQISIEGKRVYLGSFVEFSEAVNVRKLAEVAYGYHENHGKARDEDI